MRNCRLRQRDVILNIAGAHAYALANGALAFLLEQTQYLDPRRIGYGFKRQDELFVSEGHTSINTCKDRLRSM